MCCVRLSISYLRFPGSAMDRKMEARRQVQNPSGRLQRRQKHRLRCEDSSNCKPAKTLFGPDQVQLTVMTLDAQTMDGYFDDDVELLTFSSLFPFDLLRACTTHHAAVLCEGSTLKSTFANALTLFMCEAAGVMSGQGKPCIAYGSEVGEMEPFLARAAAKLCKGEESEGSTGRCASDRMYGKGRDT